MDTTLASIVWFANSCLICNPWRGVQAAPSRIVSMLAVITSNAENPASRRFATPQTECPHHVGTSDNSTGASPRR